MAEDSKSSNSSGSSFGGALLIFILICIFASNGNKKSPENSAPYAYTPTSLPYVEPKYSHLEWTLKDPVQISNHTRTLILAKGSLANEGERSSHPTIEFSIEGHSVIHSERLGEIEVGGTGPEREIIIEIPMGHAGIPDSSRSTNVSIEIFDSSATDENQRLKAPLKTHYFTSSLYMLPKQRPEFAFTRRAILWSWGSGVALCALAGFWVYLGVSARSVIRVFALLCIGAALILVEHLPKLGRDASFYIHSALGDSLTAKILPFALFGAVLGSALAYLFSFARQSGIGYAPARRFGLVLAGLTVAASCSVLFLSARRVSKEVEALRSASKTSLR